MPTWTTRRCLFWASTIALPSVQVVRQRLLDVDVLPRRAGVDGDRRVPVVGRGDQDGVEVLAVEQFLVVGRGERLRVGDLLAGVEVRLVDVADGRDPDVGDLRPAPTSSARHRPPKPIRPTLSVSFAPLAADPGKANAAAPAAVAPRKCRRDASWPGAVRMASVLGSGSDRNSLRLDDRRIRSERPRLGKGSRHRAGAQNARLILWEPWSMGISPLPRVVLGSGPSADLTSIR